MLPRSFNAEKSRELSIRGAGSDKPLPATPMLAPLEILTLAIATTAAVVISLYATSSFSNGEDVSSIETSQMFTAVDLHTALGNAVTNRQTTPIAFHHRLFVRSGQNLIPLEANIAISLGHPSLNPDDSRPPSNWAAAAALAHANPNPNSTPADGIPVLQEMITEAVTEALTNNRQNAVYNLGSTTTIQNTHTINLLLITVRVNWMSFVPSRQE
jgi:hypothetical protein